jgi:hypothetical protein
MIDTRCHCMLKLSESVELMIKFGKTEKTECSVLLFQIV